MKNPARLALLGVTLVSAASCASSRQTSVTRGDRPGATVQSWLTTGDRWALLAKQRPLVFSKGSSGNPTITVDDTKSYQSMEGFGYTLTGGSALVIDRLPAPARDALLHELFARSDTTLGVSYLRLSIGSSDLDPAPFTYDEVPAGQTDPTLANFDLGPDRAHLIPLLKRIVAINPNVALLGSPWSAPRWMKDNASYIGGSLQPRFYDAYARYLVKYIQAMKAEGITVAAITPQNEPLNPKNEPSLVMTAAQQATFVKQYLGPALRNAGLATKIILYDHNADHPEYPISILNDPAAKTFVEGSAFHLYDGPVEALSKVHDAHPDRGLYFTEQWTSSEGHFDGDLRWHLKNIIIGAPANWSRTALEWNLASDEKFGPHTPGGCTQCLGALTIDSRNGAITRNVAYYIVAHASRFVEPGSVRVASTVSGGAALPNVAYRTPAGRHVLIVLNDGAATQRFDVAFLGKSISHALGAGAVATYVW
jgi:glucosylceramidase